MHETPERLRTGDIGRPVDHPACRVARKHPTDRRESGTRNRERQPYVRAGGTAALILLTAALAACGTESGVGASAGAASAAVASAAAPTPEPTDDPTPEPTSTPEPTAEPTPQTTTFAVGDVITVTEDGEPWADITVLEVSEAAEFADPDGFYNDTPQTDGYVFLSARVRYEAIAGGVDYNPFDFQVFVDGQAVDGYTFAINAPEPQLSSGTLPAGRTAEGWLLYEVPPEGEVLLSYTGNVFLDEEPVFEVVLRE